MKNKETDKYNKITSLLDNDRSVIFDIYNSVIKDMDECEFERSFKKALHKALKPNKDV